MNKRNWLLVNVVIVIFMIIVNVNISYASDFSDIIGGGNSFISAGASSKIDASELKGTSDMIYNILLVFGMSIAIIISGILGIKFMLGSAEEKAQVKDSLIPFVIGCIVIFGAFSIWKIAVNILNQL